MLRNLIARARRAMAGETGALHKATDPDADESVSRSEHLMRSFEVVLRDGTVMSVDALSAAHAKALVCYGRTAASDSAIYDPKRRAFIAFVIHPSQIQCVREAAHGHNRAPDDD